MATAIGVVGSVLTIFSFVTDLFPDRDTSEAKYRFKIGNNNAQPPGGGGGLSGAGGSKPDVRAWDETIEFLGIEVNDGNKCGEGDTVCDTSLQTREQPTYTLFTANDDAICISVVQTTFPSSAKYATVLGNWAYYCSAFHGVSQATWYWSDIYVKREDGGSDENVKCAWIDGNGDQPATGVQIHWPDFDSTNGPTQDSAYYCNNSPVLSWRTNNDPSDVQYFTRKRDIFASHPSVATSPAVRCSADGEVELDGRNAASAPVKRQGSSDQFSSQLVKSKLEEQSASELCNAKSSAGPSFVSYAERAFCHMPTKTQYPFCDDVDSGNCWDDEADKVTTKGGFSTDSLGADDSVPAMNFTSTVVWETKDVM
ncbi:hypothetical protein KC349_g1962 [Hortaea werneckii]|nr:hypothetical protein KC349_g1962 [Hortaea werneckii]